MNESIERIIQQLEHLIHKAHVSGDKYDFIEPAHELCGELEDLDEPFEAVEPIFRLIERSPDIDFGGPGPLGAFMESFCNEGYEEQLIESVQRKPTEYTLHLLQSAMTDNNDPRQPAYIELMIRVARDQSQSEQIRHEALGHLDFSIEDIFPDPKVIGLLEAAKQLLEETQFGKED